MKIGDRIRAARNKIGMSQRELAAKVKVDKSAVAQWEGGGGGKGIRTANLVEVARVLQIKPSELLDGDDRLDSLTTTSPQEIAVITLYRLLSPALQDVHLRLLYAQTGSGHPPEQESRPGDRKIVGS
jgi:transcriptional regulator with XRE-family HTH domain